MKRKLLCFFAVALMAICVLPFKAQAATTYYFTCMDDPNTGAIAQGYKKYTVGAHNAGKFSTLNIFGWSLHQDGVSYHYYTVDGGTSKTKIGKYSRPDVLKAYPTFSENNYVSDIGYKGTININSCPQTIGQHYITIYGQPLKGSSYIVGIIYYTVTGNYVCAMDSPSFGIAPALSPTNVTLTQYDYSHKVTMDGWALTAGGTSTFVAKLNGQAASTSCVSVKSVSRSDVYKNAVCDPYKSKYSSSGGGIGFSFTIDLSKLDKTRRNIVDIKVEDNYGNSYLVATVTIPAIAGSNRVKLVTNAKGELGKANYNFGNDYLSVFRNHYCKKEDGKIDENVDTYLPYNTAKGIKTSWCAIFVTYCAKLKNSVVSTKIDSFWNSNWECCNCNKLMNQASMINKNNYSRITPGMLIFFKGSTGTTTEPGHIGIVSETVYNTRTDKLYIRYIHGNTMVNGKNGVTETGYVEVDTKTDDTKTDYIVGYTDPVY